jgi:peptidoglycan-N-acetylglucosamine deacetylase
LFLHKSNILFRTVFPKYIWRIPINKPTIYLTFDDGPVPNATEFVLKTLSKYQIKATFFCIGENVVKYPTLFNEILSNGHSIGNHTMNHLNGWNTDNQIYIENFRACAEVVPKTNLFRPPYGKIKKKQANSILQGSQIIMWDVISGDFSLDISPKECLEKSIQYTEPGTIIVFHDSEKAYKNMSFALPQYIEHFLERGYRFEPIIL